MLNPFTQKVKSAAGTQPKPPLIQRKHSNAPAPAWQTLPTVLRQHSHTSGNPGTRTYTS